MGGFKRRLFDSQTIFVHSITSTKLKNIKRVTKDVALEGYNIPRDSFALANLTGFMQVLAT